ncbi:unnamed protein product [Moneuplotes crassus]|uniref:Uncharacterized protein n=1 Tax=Euplotes crassus TaxID=5936 RepID=A0AAD1Y7D3_EUPCR|nr:unnamed protein product [Moneuplotes crassus]
MKQTKRNRERPGTAKQPSFSFTIKMLENTSPMRQNIGGNRLRLSQGVTKKEAKTQSLRNSESPRNSKFMPIKIQNMDFTTSNQEQPKKFYSNKTSTFLKDPKKGFYRVNHNLLNKDLSIDTNNEGLAPNEFFPNETQIQPITDYQAPGRRNQPILGRLKNHLRGSFTARKYFSGLARNSTNTSTSKNQKKLNGSVSMKNKCKRGRHQNNGHKIYIRKSKMNPFISTKKKSKPRIKVETKNFTKPRNSDSQISVGFDKHTDDKMLCRSNRLLYRMFNPPKKICRKSRFKTRIQKQNMLSFNQTQTMKRKKKINLNATQVIKNKQIFSAQRSKSKKKFQDILDDPKDRKFMLRGAQYRKMLRERSKEYPQNPGEQIDIKLKPSRRSQRLCRKKDTDDSNLKEVYLEKIGTREIKPILSPRREDQKDSKSFNSFDSPSVKGEESKLAKKESAYNTQNLDLFKVKFDVSINKRSENLETKELDSSQTRRGLNTIDYSSIAASNLCKVKQRFRGRVKSNSKSNADLSDVN